ncbi:hypothetical protein RISK_003014 [Rhodopirellula islandica]|uniref:Uncharacterized protein n=1 Tax=Rhodopirellula islandica TaxID=595434 RepID=A0A0J1BE07_RHOIS|nr:hypothetical protein RISK_003014 [Rhodopirellula islandica]
MPQAIGPTTSPLRDCHPATAPSRDEAEPCLLVPFRPSSTTGADDDVLC